jgi:hypothetical protein
MPQIKPIVNQVSANLRIGILDKNSELCKKLNVPASIGLSLPEWFWVPEKANIQLAKMEYLRLIDKNTGKPTIGIGIAVYLPNGEQKIISLNSLLRSFYESEPPKDAKDDTKFVTKGIERLSVVDALQGVQTMNFAPLDLLFKYLAGKTIKRVDTRAVFVPKYNDDHQLIAYEEAEKPFFTVTNEKIEKTGTDNPESENPETESEKPLTAAQKRALAKKNAEQGNA